MKTRIMFYTHNEEYVFTTYVIYCDFILLYFRIYYVQYYIEDFPRKVQYNFVIMYMIIVVILTFSINQFRVYNYKRRCASYNASNMLEISHSKYVPFQADIIHKVTV